MKILHFADAHIDMANYGRLDPSTRLPLRVLDFLRSLDEIVQTAIDERVDAVLFAGDAYKDRHPSPTYQREWGKRITRLAQAGIPVFLLVGNHDTSPSQGRAHALHEFATLAVPGVYVLDAPKLWRPDETGLPLQILAVPWLGWAEMVAALDLQGLSRQKVLEELESRLSWVIENLMAQADPALPLILMAHASVMGATYGAERMVMLGNDLTLSASLLKDPRLDYVALGHIHKAQNLTSDVKASRDDPPPVVYPGSIERVDFGEADEKKYFVLVEVQPGQAQVHWRELEHIRPFLQCFVQIDEAAQASQKIFAALPPAEALQDAIVRLTIRYPEDLETVIDEEALRRYAAGAFEFRLNRYPQRAARLRLPAGQNVEEMSPLDLLRAHFLSKQMEPAEVDTLLALAQGILQDEPEEKGRV